MIEDVQLVIYVGLPRNERFTLFNKFMKMREFTHSSSPVLRCLDVCEYSPYTVIYNKFEL